MLSKLAHDLVTFVQSLRVSSPPSNHQALNRGGHTSLTDTVSCMDRSDFILNPANIPYNQVTHAIDVTLRDWHCNRIEATVVLNPELADQLLIRDLDDLFPHHSIRAWGDVRTFQLA